MIKKFVSMATATLLLATGISVVVAPSANAYASNAGAVNTETRVFVEPDVNGNFPLPAGVTTDIEDTIQLVLGLATRFSMEDGATEGEAGEGAPAEAAAEGDAEGDAE